MYDIRNENIYLLLKNSTISLVKIVILMDRLKNGCIYGEQHNKTSIVVDSNRTAENGYEKLEKKVIVVDHDK